MREPWRKTCDAPFQASPWRTGWRRLGDDDVIGAARAARCELTPRTLASTDSRAYRRKARNFHRRLADRLGHAERFPRTGHTGSQRHADSENHVGSRPPRIPPLSPFRRRPRGCGSLRCACAGASGHFRAAAAGPAAAAVGASGGSQQRRHPHRPPRPASSAGPRQHACGRRPTPRDTRVEASPAPPSALRASDDRPPAIGDEVARGRRGHLRSGEDA